MTLAQHIRLLPFDDLLIIADTIEKEIARRNDFIDCLAGIPLKTLGLTNNTRDLLYRIVQSKMSVSDAKKNGGLTVRDLFYLLKKEDWCYIEYLNTRAFLEIGDALIRHEAPLENYYGQFTGKSAKKAKTAQRFIEIVDVELTKQALTDAPGEIVFSGRIG